MCVISSQEPPLICLEVRYTGSFFPICHLHRGKLMIHPHTLHLCTRGRIKDIGNPNSGIAFICSFSFHLLAIKHGSWYVYQLGRNDRSTAEIDMTIIILVTVATAVAGSVLGGYILDSRFHIRNDFHQLRVALGSALK